MRLIERVQVRNFRSLRLAQLSDIDPFSPIIGRNGTGKSNFLRVLNLFFNGFLDEAQSQLDLAHDFSDTLSKKKREVQVRVSFDLSNGYDARHFRDNLEGQPIGDTLVIERTWNYFPGTRQAYEAAVQYGPAWDDLGFVDSAQELTALQTFLRSVHFRYIPNHARPTDLIASELPPLPRLS